MTATNIKLAIITSGGANFYSVEAALQRLGINYELSNDKKVIDAADGVILPGVGSASYAMQQLAKDDLIEVIRNYQKPLLGICLGMQLLYGYSAEGNVPCLGILPGVIKKFVAAKELVVPQMGWNNLIQKKNSALLNGVDFKKDVYFVHSYYAPVNKATLASCYYGEEFSAIANEKNFYAMQFHPEKSGLIGAMFLKNFVEIVNDSLSSN